MKHKLKAIMLAMISAIFVFGANAQADTISVVSDTAYAPFEFKDSDQVYKGIDVDIINEVANREGWDVEMTFPGFDAAVNAVQAGQADALMAGTTVTEARKKVFTFSDTYYDTAVVVYTRSDAKVTNYKQLSGKTVGVKNGTAAQSFLKENQKKYNYKIKTFDTSDLMNNSLDAGSIYAAMDDQPVVQYAINQGKDYAINIDGEKVGSFAFAVKKGSKYEYLIDEFNEAFDAMKEDGTYDAIMAKWLGDSEDSADKSTVVTSDSLKLSGDASAKATPVKSTYKIVMDSSFAPFEYQNDSGKYEGIDVDLIKAIAEQQGFNIELSNPGFDAALNAVQAGQADAVIAGMSITDARKEIFDFSDPYYTSNILLAVKKGSSVKSYEDLNGMTVGAKNGTASYTWLSEHADQYGYSLRAFDEASTMYDSLNSGSIDALMDDEAVLRYAIKQGRKFETPIDGEKSGEYGFAVNKGANPELLEMFNNGLAALVKSGKYDKIVNKYLGTSENKKSSSSVDETTIWGLIKNNYSQLLTGLGTTLSLTLISFAIAMVIGIIFGMMAVAPNKVLRTISAIFVDVVRGIPLMIVAAFIFWGIPNLIESMTGHQSPINDFLAATIALSLNAGAYIAEIVRGGIEAVPKGQMEASRSLGISYGKTMKKVILPQAVRVMLPNFINQFVISLKDTTIVSAIGLVELFQTGKIIIARNYQSFRMYAILAVIYLVMITLLTRLAKRLEKRLK
ncbi:MULTISPECIES: ABC transporter substrate-binding protein/permease [Streptococcus]|jgi:glutamine transport system permease protein|uniref:ABC transporter substrate-binding protein/permease n=1 Tax=Streptococcus TaxID=1301 RepID=UPI00038B087E|nr:MULTISPECIES: ABC transporter substrate-binding protein/permease [Streptococcus]EQC69273.1 Glutamine ABC transporter, glutamine-binding protein/permease protein [Streptococcus sp. HSISB1]MDO4886675.1 ABC transporter substrate-binding protein/permease [Streptococcus sp.]QGX47201.1 ABC transporter permease subunit [Streptococcus equinus]UOC10523.1 ABC transporter substrate-binding protein/permease [Streptococcus equinus]SEK27952.1 amino acid ABC transporter substrate-binding protein, PAAT fam